jgi:hypothetical protein
MGLISNIVNRRFYLLHLLSKSAYPASSHTLERQDKPVCVSLRLLAGTAYGTARQTETRVFNDRSDPMNGDLTHGQATASNRYSNRLRWAELTSGIGAITLGVGLGSLFEEYVGAYAIPILVIGVLTHGWGMIDKRRLDSMRDANSVWWSELLYWICWAALIFLIIYLAIRMSQS